MIHCDPRIGTNMTHSIKKMRLLHLQRPIFLIAYNILLKCLVFPIKGQPRLRYHRSIHRQIEYSLLRIKV